MIVVTATAKVQPGTREQAIKLAEVVVAATRKETGCLTYTFYSSLEDPDRFFAFEEWETEAALEKHLASAHVATFYAGLAPLLMDTPVITRYVATKKA